MNSTLSCFAKGFRTLIAVLGFIICGVLSVAGSIDLTPLVTLFVKNQAYLGATMVCVGLLFGWLRYLTTTPLFRKAQDGDGLKRGCDTGM